MRNGDVPEPSQGAGAIDARRFVQLFRNTLEARYENEHVVTKVLPDRHDDDRRHRPPRVAEPVDRAKTHVPEEVVEEAIPRMIEVAPDDGDGDEGRHERREVDGPKDAAEPDGARIHEQRRA